MSSAPSLPFLRRIRKRQPALTEAPGPSDRTTTSRHVVDIYPPDSESAALLLEYAAPSFPAMVVAGPPCVVTLQPPLEGGTWVLDLVTLVERWLESTQLPSTNLLYGGRTYLILPSPDPATTAAAADPML